MKSVCKFFTVLSLLLLLSSCAAETPAIPITNEEEPVANAEQPSNVEEKPVSKEAAPIIRESIADKYTLDFDADDIAMSSFTASYEFEDAVLNGTKVDNVVEGYSGTNYVTDFSNDSTTADITIEFPETGRYDLSFVNSAYYGYKENPVYLSEEFIGKIISDDKASDIWQTYTIKNVYIEAGVHVLSVRGEWGWFLLDRVDITPAGGLDRELYNVSAELINPNADDSAKRLMKYLSDTYGEYTISGQFQDAGFSSEEIQTIRALTGRYPAICGFDFMDYSPSRIKYGAKPLVTNNAIQWWNEQGGIVTFSWHWNAPEPYLPNTNDSPWWSGFYTRATNIDLAKIMNGDDSEGYDLLIRDIDAIAVQLKSLQDAGVPVLWRPLHEASGGWFWWGASGAEAYVKLWRLLYDRLTNHHGINNLIWVMNCQSGDWYPGDEYVDIIGEDIYPDKHDYSSQLARFTQASEYTPNNKIIALTENGTMPDPDLIYRDGCNWAWFCTWSGEFVLNGTEYSEVYTEKQQLDKLYNHEKVITLDELPDLRTYPLVSLYTWQ